MFRDGVSHNQPSILPEETSPNLSAVQRKMFTYKRLQTELGMDKQRIAEGIEAIVMGRRADDMLVIIKSRLVHSVCYNYFEKKLRIKLNKKIETYHLNIYFRDAKLTSQEFVELQDICNDAFDEDDFINDLEHYILSTIR